MSVDTHECLGGCRILAWHLRLLVATTLSLQTMAAIDVGNYSGGGPSSVSSFADGDTLDGVSVHNKGLINFPAGTVTHLATGALSYSNLPFSDFDRVWKAPGTNLLGAVFINQGTWNYNLDTASRAGLDLEGTFDFEIRNEGVFDSSVTSSVAKCFYFGSGGDKGIVNTGTWRHSGIGNFGWEVANSYFHNDGGTIECTGSGILNIQGAAAIRNRCTAGSVFNTTGGGRIVLHHDWTELRGSATGAPVYGSTVFGTVNSAVIDVAEEGMVWVDIDLNSGVATNLGLLVTEQDGGQVDIFNGTLRNLGTISQRGTARFFFFWTGNQFTYENSGLHEYADPSSGNRMGNHGGDVYFDNQPDGIYKTAAGSGNATFEEITPNSIFRNRGTVEAGGGAINFFNWGIDARTLDADGNLQEGTWMLSSNDVSISFIRTNFISPDVTAPNIATIGTNAAVILGLGNDINKLTEASLTSIYGRFGLHGGRTWTTGGAVTTDASTRLEFGLDDSGSDAKLVLSEDTTLNATIDAVDLGNLQGGDYTVVEMASGKALTKGVITEGTITTTQKLEIVVTVYPGLDGTVVLGVKPPPGGSVIVVR